jgi:RND family efflux transporter MFP subunit
VDVGNLVGAGERTLLATIVQDEPIYAYFNVSERDLLRYREEYRKQQTPANGNGKTRVYLGLSNESGYPHEGRVDYVDNRVQADTGTIQVRGVFPNPDAVLLPGLFVRIRATLGKRENALLVPERALGSDQQGRFVLVVNNQNIVEYRPVKIGTKVNGMRVIENGITDHDRVIINGLQRARPGAPVDPVQAEAKAAANEPDVSKDISHGENDHV